MSPKKMVSKGVKKRGKGGSKCKREDILSSKEKNESQFIANGVKGAGLSEKCTGMSGSLIDCEDIQLQESEKAGSEIHGLALSAPPQPTVAASGYKADQAVDQDASTILNSSYNSPQKASSNSRVSYEDSSACLVIDDSVCPEHVPTSDNTDAVTGSGGASQRDKAAVKVEMAECVTSPPSTSSAAPVSRGILRRGLKIKPRSKGPRRRRVSRRPVPKKNTSIKDLDDASVPMDAEAHHFDQLLQEKASKSRISVRNVKSMIKSIISHEQVQAMMQYTMAKEADPKKELPAFEATKMTRSRARQLLAESALTEAPLTPVKRASEQTEQLVHHEFPEDDDDEEYTPRKAESAQSSPLSSPAPSTPCSSLAAPQTPTTPGSAAGEEPLSKRTRSRLPLTDQALESLEQMLKAPDVTPDMYNPVVDDDDWSDFLRAFNMPLDKVQGQEEDDEDEEYVFQANEDEEVELEELRRDPGAQITQKEVNRLMLELFRDVSHYQQLPEYPASEPAAASAPPPPPPADPPGTSQPPTVHLLSAMTAEQARLLDFQMTAHVQLLAQTYVLCAEQPWLATERAGAATLLVELNTLSRSLRSEDPTQSFFHPPNLAPALQLCADWDKVPTEELTGPGASEVFSTRARLTEYHCRFSQRVVDALLNSTAFVFPKLLPATSPFQSKLQTVIRSVDRLIAMGLEQFTPYGKAISGKDPVPKLYVYTLISKHMMPIPPRKIKDRVLSAIELAREDNPISVFLATSRAPPVEPEVLIPEYPLVPMANRPMCSLPEPWRTLASQSDVDKDTFFTLRGEGCGYLVKDGKRTKVTPKPPPSEEVKEPNPPSPPKSSEGPSSSTLPEGREEPSAPPQVVDSPPSQPKKRPVKVAITGVGIVSGLGTPRLPCPSLSSSSSGSDSEYETDYDDPRYEDPDGICYDHEQGEEDWAAGRSAVTSHSWPEAPEPTKTGARPPMYKREVQTKKRKGPVASTSRQTQSIRPAPSTERCRTNPPVVTLTPLTPVSPKSSERIISKSMRRRQALRSIDKDNYSPEAAEQSRFRPRENSSAGKANSSTGNCASTEQRSGAGQGGILAMCMTTFTDSLPGMVPDSVDMAEPATAQEARADPIVSAEEDQNQPSSHNGQPSQSPEEQVLGAPRSLAGRRDDSPGVEDRSRSHSRDTSRAGKVALFPGSPSSRGQETEAVQTDQSASRTPVMFGALPEKADVTEPPSVRECAGVPLEGDQNRPGSNGCEQHQTITRQSTVILEDSEVDELRSPANDSCMDWKEAGTSEANVPSMLPVGASKTNSLVTDHSQGANDSVGGENADIARRSRPPASDSEAKTPDSKGAVEESEAISVTVCNDNSQTDSHASGSSVTKPPAGVTSTIELKEEDGQLVVYLRTSDPSEPLKRVPVCAPAGAIRLLLPPSLTLRAASLGRSSNAKVTGVVTPTVRPASPAAPEGSAVDPEPPPTQPAGAPASPAHNLAERPPASCQERRSSSLDSALFKLPFTPLKPKRRVTFPPSVITAYPVTVSTAESGGAAAAVEPDVSDAALPPAGEREAAGSSTTNTAANSGPAQAPSAVVEDDPQSVSLPGGSGWSQSPPHASSELQLPAMMPPALMTPRRGSPQQQLCLGFPTPLETPAVGGPDLSDLQTPLPLCTPQRRSLDTPLVPPSPARQWMLETPQIQRSPVPEVRTPPGQGDGQTLVSLQDAGSADAGSDSEKRFFQQVGKDVKSKPPEPTVSEVKPGPELMSEQSLSGILEELLVRPGTEHQEVPESDAAPGPSTTDSGKSALHVPESEAAPGSSTPDSRKPALQVPESDAAPGSSTPDSGKSALHVPESEVAPGSSTPDSRNPALQVPESVTSESARLSVENRQEAPSETVCAVEAVVSSSETASSAPTEEPSQAANTEALPSETAAPAPAAAPSTSFPQTAPSPVNPRAAKTAAATRIRTRSESASPAQKKASSTAASSSTGTKAAVKKTEEEGETKAELKVEETASQVDLQTEEGRESSAQPLASAATAPPVGRSRSKRSRQQREAELTQLALAPESQAERERRDFDLVFNFYQRVKESTESIDPAIYEQFSKLLAAFSEAGPAGDQVALYDGARRLLRGFPELLEEFLGMLDPQVAVERDCVVEHLRANNTTQLVRRIENVHAGHPMQIQKVARSLTQLASRSEGGLRASELRACALPLTRACPLLASGLSALIDSEPPPAQLMKRHDDFEVAVLDAPGVEDDDGFEVVNDLTDGYPDPYGTDQCQCQCHTERADDARYHQRRRHCERCGLRFIGGRAYLQTGKVLRPARIIDISSTEATETSQAPVVAVDPTASPPTKRARRKPPAAKGEKSKKASGSGAGGGATVKSGTSGAATSKSSTAGGATSKSSTAGGATSKASTAGAATSKASTAGTTTSKASTAGAATSKASAAGATTSKASSAGGASLQASASAASLDEPSWSREEDLEILTSCQKSGDGEKTFRAIQRKLPQRSTEQLQQRFQHLIDMLREQLQAAGEDV